MILYVIIYPRIQYVLLDTSSQRIVKIFQYLANLSTPYICCWRDYATKIHFPVTSCERGRKNTALGSREAVSASYIQKKEMVSLLL